MEDENEEMPQIVEKPNEKQKEEKEKRIKKEERFLKGFFNNLDKDKMKFIEKLIKKAAFMSVTLDDLQDIINEDGVVDIYKNGKNQFGTKKSPEVEVYNSMMKNFTALTKQLCDLLPDNKETEKNKAGNDLLNFIMQQKVKK